MATNLIDLVFDHPYATTGNECNDSDKANISESEMNFEDSPRKVLVQENITGNLNFLNDIIQNDDFSCFNRTIEGCKKNGFSIDNNFSSSDEMEVNKASIEEPGFKVIEAKGNSNLEKTVPEDKKENEILEKKDSDIESTEVIQERNEVNAETADKEHSKVLDIFRGITNIFDSKEMEQKSSVNGIQDEEFSNKEESEHQNKNGSHPVMSSREDWAETDDQNEVPVGSEQEKEMDTSANDTVDNDDDETDDADEGDLDNSLENATDLTSEIKSNTGNGIKMSVKRKRRKKRKNSQWTKPSPYKIRRVSSGSPRRVSIDDNSQHEKGEKYLDGNFSKDGIASEKNEEVENTGTQTEEEGERRTRLSKDESTESDVIEERLRSQRSKTPARKEGFDFGDEAFKDLEMIDATDPEKGHQRKKNLLFHKGRKASPAQIKSLTPEEAEKYKEPFKQGWKRELVFRGAYSENSGKTQADTYYFPPTGPKLRSMVQINEWLNSHETTLTPENFTFMRRAIGVEGEMVRNASQSRGKAVIEAAHKKRRMKAIKDADIHDDNDGQYDEPEVVIERDSDDFLAPIISAVDKEVSPKKDTKRGRPPKNKVMSNIPNLEELKEEKVETMHPSKEEVIISPSKKKTEHKATARKSTTQKSFKKPLPYTGVENLCSLRCPGMEGIPPMLHCNVCMCLFHNECVNYFGQDGDFICLRCNDTQASSSGGTAPATSVEGNVMKLNLPNLIDQFNASTATSVQNTLMVYPVAGETSPSTSSQGLNTNLKGNRVKVATPPSSILPLYKMLPMISGSQGLSASSASPKLSLPCNTTYNYPVLLTKNTSALNSSSSSSKSPFTVYPTLTLKSQTATTASSVTATCKSSVLTDIINAKVQSDYPEIRPLIKQEPVDDSYGDTVKSTKSSQKGTSTTKASTEALFNLKSVLSSRLGSPLSASDVLESKSKALTNMNPLPMQTFSPVPAPVRLMNNVNPSFLTNSSQLTLSQNINQPRMAFNLNSPQQNQFLQNQEYRIVPIGPPMPLSQLKAQMPLLQGKSGLPMTSTPVRPSVTQSPLISQKQDNILTTSVVVSTQEESGTPVTSGPLVVNAKSVTPMNGQLLTLPPPVVKKLTLNKPLALKINNRQITVPPSGFFQSVEGLKVFLPPNTFPTADENVVNVSVSNEKSHEDETVTLSKSSTSKSCAESQNSAKTDTNLETDKTDKNCDKAKPVQEMTSAKTLDIRKNKFYNKCCLLKRLDGGLDCMFHIFQFLDLKDLVRVSQVCKAWRRINLLPDLWACVSFSGTKVSDWGKALNYISRRDVQSVSLKGLVHFEEPNRTWHQLVSSLDELLMLKQITFGLVPAAVLQSVAGKLTQLESFIAEFISDFTDDSMWNIPTKLDVGNFRCMSDLQELKLRGTGGLSLPSFSFGCGFSDIGKLSNLQTLHLTSLRNLEGSDFNFISRLQNLKDLALGDCDKWTKETYSHLQQLTLLQRLRLESGGDIPDPGLGLALSQLSQLESLELKKYTVAYTFGNHVSALTKLRHLKIFPVNTHYMGEVNTNTLKAVETLKQLKTLEWTIPQTSVSSIILDDNDNTDIDQTMEEKQHWIPFQTVGDQVAMDNVKSSAAQYINVHQLKERLDKSLPDTKVKVCTTQTEKKLS